MPSSSMRVYISRANPQLASEQAVAQRVVQAFSAAQLDDDPAMCDLYIGLLDLEPDYASLSEFTAVLAQKTVPLLFVREAPLSQRNVHLTELLIQLQSQPRASAHFFHSELDLARRLTMVITRQLSLLQAEGWHVPPLPLREVPCIGREDALSNLAILLRGVQPVVIKGESGMGKSTLALEFAYLARDRFDGGVFWLDAFGDSGQPFQAALRKLASVHPAGRLAVAEGRRITPTDVRGWLAVASGKILVIVDDAPGGSLLRDLRAALPTGSSLVITAAPSFNEAGWSSYDLLPLTNSASLELLHQTLHLPETLAEEVVRPLQNIIELIGGHPQNLGLAAGWMQRAGGWQSALIYLKRLSESSNSRQILRMLVNSLSPRQKSLFYTAGVFAPNSPFTAEALLTVADSPHAHLELDELTPTLFSLDEATGGYRLHEQLHHEALDQLEAEGMLSAAVNRHVSYYESLLTQWSGDMREGEAPPDLAQLRRAFAHTRRYLSGRLPAYALSAGQYLHTLHYDEELWAWLDATLEVTAIGSPHSSGDRESQPAQLRALGDLSLKISHTAAAQEFYERALLLYYALKSLPGQANTLKALGDLQAAQGHREEAQEYYDRTLLLYAQIDFQLGRANTLKALGDLSLQGGDTAAAREYYERTLELSEQIDFQLGQAHTLRALGDLSLLERDVFTAREHYRAALNLYTDINFHSQQAATLIQLGKLDAQTNAIESAHRAYEEALRLFKQAGDKQGQAAALEANASLHQDQNDLATAKTLLEKAREIYHLNGEEPKAAAINLRLTPIFMGMNDPANAVRITLKALRTFHTLQDKVQMESTRRQLRELARKIGGVFPQVWSKVTDDAPIPDWLKLAPSTALPQSLIYAVRDFMLAPNLDASQRIVQEHLDMMLTDEADEVFAQMLRQYAGQVGPTRQIDKYRALLQRCRQVGINAAFAEERAPAAAEKDSQATRLHQSLGAYDEALERLRDIPLVYASVQINRANTLHELAAMPHQDRFACLQEALDAYSDALRHQSSSPLDYAQTQISRAQILHELAELPGANAADYLRQTLDAYTEALQYQQGLPLEYARTQLSRANTLRELGELPDQDAIKWLREALLAYNEALTYQHDVPLDYAQTQSNRALLLHEMAGLLGENFTQRMNEALTAYDEALEYLRDDDPLGYARTQTNRVALLRDMAGLPGEDRTARLYQALAACNEALRYLANAPRDYAKLQLNRAALMREIAGLTGEHRLARMREALAIYNDILTYLTESPLEYAAVQNSRASLLRELAGLGGENRVRRLRESLEAASEAILILEKLEGEVAQLRNAQRMTINTRKEIINSEGLETFNAWWQQIVRTPQPDWLYS